MARAKAKNPPKPAKVFSLQEQLKQQKALKAKIRNDKADAETQKLADAVAKVQAVDSATSKPA